MSYFPSRKAWLAYRQRPKGPRFYWVHVGGTFDRSRNAEKRQASPDARRTALIDRMARRRRASWKRERNRLDLRAQVLGGAA